MKMSVFEFMMNELDRKVLEASAANHNLVMQRMRRLSEPKDRLPGPEHKTIETYGDDDLLFDNVPI
ncbi:hypothetical protein [Pararhodobacter sp.]|uniref:hypothetical protein n=1 Tax=Pararhodobacter sp. TaxID=2127056 RepID=UPI002AFEB30A|nr:hypothetical protein [Pararhodobacter sp.]